ncbi:hypothetical protein BpHYR1_033260 [Brachionus plicatilis]|uniref:Uncharacterized protein n=1 Tax=Brachionus plicatilis TaxID=10195 RepID=A0A3M7T7I8_BRAPC|nr:hypothetical protein BpHYR1_033260 [Brachionus plicatilis]
MSNLFRNLNKKCNFRLLLGGSMTASKRKEAIRQSNTSLSISIVVFEMNADSNPWSIFFPGPLSLCTSFRFLFTLSLPDTCCRLKLEYNFLESMSSLLK